MKKIIFSAFVLSLMISCQSNAQSTPSNQSKEGKRKELPSYKELLTKMDTNKDGKLAKSEIQGRLKDDFDKIDTDKNGFLIEEEFNKAPKPLRRPKR